MHLKNDFKTMELNDQIIAVPIGDDINDFHCVIKMNGTASAIMNLLKVDTTETEIVDTLIEIYDVDRDTLAKDVSNYIQMFKDKGFIVE